MHHYPHHISDFNSATRHLTRIERSVYRDLLDLYYDTEQALTSDFEKLCRLVIARTDEERTAVQQVLNEFFTQTDQGWVNSRCEAEIERYRGNKEAKSAAGRASAAKRASKPQHPSSTSSTAVQQPLNECATNQNQEPEPRTKNQEPEEKHIAPSQGRSRVSAEPKPKLKAAKPVATPMPEGFQISEGVRAWAEREGHANSLDDHFAYFVDVALAKGYTYANWDRALMRAIRDNWAKVGQPRTAPTSRYVDAREAENERRKADFLRIIDGGTPFDDPNTIDMEPIHATR